MAGRTQQRFIMSRSIFILQINTNQIFSSIHGGQEQYEPRIEINRFFWFLKRFSFYKNQYHLVEFL